MRIHLHDIHGIQMNLESVKKMAKPIRNKAKCEWITMVSYMVYDR